MVTKWGQHVFYRDTDSYVHHIWWDNREKEFHEESYTTTYHHVPAVAGDPVTMVTNGGQHVFFRDNTDGGVHHLWWSDF
jgi:hypothetical protein